MPDSLAKTDQDSREFSVDPAPPAKPRPDQLPPTIDPHTNAIFLDIDGTLLDIASTPLEVKVSDALRATLAALSREFAGAVAFVSGRPIAEMDRLFDPLRLAAVGGHGAEIRFAPDGKIRRADNAMLDDALRAEFSRIGRIGDGVIVEDKGYSLAIHYRLAPHLGGEIMKSVTAVCKNDRCDSLEILPGKAVVEIKPGGYDKGTGLREMMSVPPFTGRKPIFVGDDVTDNAAFAVLPDFHGTGFSVGGVVPGTSFNFDGPQDVRGWLRHLSEERR
ncbi:MAG: trehalose-phosphatase [Pseudorhodoplanes sp.]|uniref:trehalose-phosphatase n=1 Tax=Pseudorhodoplanes sp. TaxID=1934341 RepID=UPI003D0B94F2